MTVFCCSLLREAILEGKEKVKQPVKKMMVKEHFLILLRLAKEHSRYIEYSQYLALRPYPRR